MFVETNPIPVKAAMAEMGLVKEEFRLPLCPPSDESREIIRTALKNQGLI
jgi:4-hydroxy-tetrahydrodipicolinate synthase